MEIVHFCGFPNKKAIRMDGFHLLAELFLMACGDGALTCFYGIAISIERSARGERLGRKDLPRY